MKLFEIFVDKPIVIDLVQNLLDKNKTVNLDFQSRYSRSVGQIYALDWNTFDGGGSEFSILYYNDNDDYQKACLGLTGEAAERLELTKEVGDIWLLHGKSTDHATP